MSNVTEHAGHLMIKGFALKSRGSCAVIPSLSHWPQPLETGPFVSKNTRVVGEMAIFRQLGIISMHDSENRTHQESERSHKQHDENVSRHKGKQPAEGCSGYYSGDSKLQDVLGHSVPAYEYSMS